MTAGRAEPYEPGQPVSWWARPLVRGASAAFGAVSGLRKLAYDRSWLPVRWVSVPVVSVGNLVVGGTGKTPFVIWLSDFLTRQGRRVAVVSRGYRRAQRGRCPVVVSMGDGPVVSEEVSGDEPMLIARRTRAMVIVDPDRVRGARHAVKLGAQVIVVDDGFSHRRLGRDLDLVLLDGMSRPNGFLPGGPLREPQSALSRADICAVVGPTLSSTEPQDRPFVRAQVIPTAVYGPKTDPFPAGRLAGRRVALLCAIARPLRFRRTVEALGATVVHEQTYRDHTRHGVSTLETFLTRATETGADYALTTEKDAMRIPEPWPEPLKILRIDLEIVHGGNHLEWALLRVGALG